MPKTLLTASVLVVTLLSAQAQPGDPGGDPGAGQPVPLGGIEILLAAGALLGIKKSMQWMGLAKNKRE